MSCRRQNLAPHAIHNKTIQQLLEGYCLSATQQRPRKIVREISTPAHKMECRNGWESNFRFPKDQVSKLDTTSNDPSQPHHTPTIPPPPQQPPSRQPRKRKHTNPRSLSSPLKNVPQLKCYSHIKMAEAPYSHHIHALTPLLPPPTPPTPPTAHSLSNKTTPQIPPLPPPPTPHAPQCLLPTPSTQ